jgi:hypothetical protein
MEIDHLFVFVEPGAPEARALEALGLVESFRRRHPGQGTENACYCFDDSYLELLWVNDPAEVGAPALARPAFAARSGWRGTGASPFGISVRGDLPFPSWDYRPGYLPPGMSIPVALDSDDPRLPFVFRSPGTARPDAWTDGRAGARQRPGGFAEIAGIRLELPRDLDPGPALRRMEGLGLLSVAAGDRHRMELTLSRTDGGPCRRLLLPDFTWG